MNAGLTFCVLVTVCLVRGDDVQLLTSAQYDFSQRLYQKIAVNTSNAIYSPYSIHSALTMTLNGACGKTAKEISQVLGLTSLQGDSAHKAYSILITQLTDAKDIKLNTANAIFVNPRIQIKTQFISKIREKYFAVASHFDLAAEGGPEKAINDFVDHNTEGMIKNILPEGSINPDTVMILINTIFFNGTWDTVFDKHSTKKQDFQQLCGTSQVDMMYDERYVNIKKNVNGVDVAELPFKGKRFSLYIALPQKTDGITDLETRLSEPGCLDSFFEGLAPIHVDLYIPKFKIEHTYGLNSPLQQLGIVNAFIPGVANFKGISKAGNVYISDVIHKAVIEVTETGTVAAAATAISVGFLSAKPIPAETFKADHPFVFFLRDNLTKSILFQGKFSG